MNTLELYISKSSGETRLMAEINPTDEGRKAASDVRSAVTLVDYPATEKAVFLVVVNVAGGYAIHIVRTIPPTRPNHLDATIYIDRALDVMADDLREVIDKVSAIVLAKSVTESDMASLRELFACEYDKLDKVPRVKASHGRDYACLTYDDRSAFDDLLDEGLYRSGWSDYRGVIILPADLHTLPNSVVDLSLTDDEADQGLEDEEPEASVSAAHDRRSHGYSYVLGLPIVTSEGRSILEFEVESAKPLTKSPVQGYEMVGRPRPGTDVVTRLRRSSGQSLKERLGRWLWGFSGLIVGVIIMSIFNYCSDDVPDATPKTPAVTASAEKPAAKPSSASDTKPVTVLAPEAVAYLDANKVWRLDDMEKIPDLRGLFDDLNNFRLEQIVDVWGDRLAGSENFARVVKAARKSLARKVDPRRDPDEHNPAYNRAGDTAISWLGYTYWIDP